MEQTKGAAKIIVFLGILAHMLRGASSRRALSVVSVLDQRTPGAAALRVRIKIFLPLLLVSEK
jgi:hypothetical protein